MGGNFYPDPSEEINCLNAWVSQSFKTPNTFLKYGALRTSKKKALLKVTLNYFQMLHVYATEKLFL